MKILIWSYMFSIGGGGRLLTNLATALARQPGVQYVRVVLSAQTGFKDRVNTQQHPKIDIVYCEEDIRNTPNHPYIADCDVVYVFWPHGPAFVDFHKPTVITFHDATILDYVPPFTPGSVVREHWEKAKVWLERSTHVVVSSEYVKSRLVAHFGPICQSTFLIPHAISPSKVFENPALDSSLAQSFPFPYFIYPANTSPHKNHYNLLLAYSRFSRRSQHPLLLIGYNTQMLRSVPPYWPELASIPTLVSLIKRLGLQIDKDVFPLGLVLDQLVAPLIKNAYALIMPSLAEGGGSYPVEEALSMGTPVLCSDIPVMREHLARRSAEVAWFNPESPDDMTRAMESLADNYAHYKQSAIRGMNDPTISWDDIAKHYIAVFQSSHYLYRGFYL